MAGSLGASVALGIIKLIVYTFDFITLPAYFIIQRPWIKWKSKNDIWGGPMVPGDPCSPIVRKKFVVKITENIFQQAKTITAMFKTCVEKYQDRKCLGTREILNVEEEIQEDGGKIIKKSLGDYKWLTFKEADQKIEKLSRGFLAIGMQPKDYILIFAETRMEWMLSALAIFHTGGTAVTLYPSLGDEAVAYGINESEVSVIVTSQELLQRLRKLISQTPKVKTIICMETFGPFSLKDFPDEVMVITLSQFEKLGTTVRDVSYINPTADDIAVVMYTSGSTGIPKGVMLTHSNILAMDSEFYLTYGNHILTGRPLVSFLPLSHIMEFTIELYVLGCGVPIAYSSPATLTDNSTGIKQGEKGDISVIEPGLLVAGPIILDRMHKSVCETISKKGAFVEKLFNFTMNRSAYWRRLGFQTNVLDSSIIFRKFRCILGKNLKNIFTGGAALAPDTQQFSRICLGVKVFQGYGLTETSATGTVMHRPPAPGVYIRLRDWEEAGYCSADKPNPRGELIIGGNGIARGYFKQDELTRKSFFEENGIKWFYTGDIGEIYPNGSIKIIDRKKGLIKLQHGEYISLSKVETELKTCPLIENICALGDLYSTFLVALIVPNKVMLEKLAKRLGKSHQNFTELCNDPIIIQEVTKKVKEQAIKCDLQKTETPQKIRLCTEQWSPDNNMLTATFKLRRHYIRQFYDEDVRELYGEVNRSLKTY